MLQTFTYRSKAELGSHLSSSELDLIFSRAVLAAIVALIGFHCSVRNLEQLNGISLFSLIRVRKEPALDHQHQSPKSNSLLEVEVKKLFRRRHYSLYIEPGC